jgi:hypothetical protein
MQLGVSAARKQRVRHRHKLHTLTYVTLDQANGGILRDLNHEGIAVQAVAALPAGQQVRLRFELPHTRLRIETRGEVVWSRSTGQCGIRFLDLPARTRGRIDEWIFGHLLEGLAPPAVRPGSRVRTMFHRSESVPGPLPRPDERAKVEEDDGLILSPAPVKVIELPGRPATPSTAPAQDAAETLAPSGAASSDTEPVELDWLSQPLSGRGIAWSINTLAVLAGLLLFALVFLSVTRESPRWPATMIAGAAVFVAAFYWGFFKLFGGTSPGARLARLAGYDCEDEPEADGTRFR